MITHAKALEAATALELDLDLVLEQGVVTAAFRQESKKCHPDSGKHDAARWSRISWARDTLTEWLKRPGDLPGKAAALRGTCKACQGTGRVTGRSGLKMFCVLCNGTGNAVKRDREE